MAGGAMAGGWSQQGRRIRSLTVHCLAFSLLLAASQVAASDEVLYKCGSTTFTLQTSRCDNMTWFGCYGAEARTQVFAQTDPAAPVRKQVPCGYRRGSGFTWLRAQLADLKCDAAVYTGHFGTAGRIELPPVEPSHTEEEGTICHVLVIDDAAAAHLSATILNSGWMVLVIDALPYSDSPARSLSALKLLGGQLFPRSVQQTIYFDAKLRVSQVPASLFHLLGARGVAAFRHPAANHTSVTSLEERIDKRQHLQLQKGVDGQTSAYLQGLRRQHQTYTAEQWDLKRTIETSVLIRSYRPEHLGCTLLFECAWYGEVEAFTPWDQPSAPYVLNKLRLWRHVNVLPGRSKALLLDHQALPPQLLANETAVGAAQGATANQTSEM